MGTGNATAGLAAGGETSTAVTGASEEWNQGITTKTIDTD